MRNAIMLRMRKAERQAAGMILSVSRRTDIPQFYSDWFFNRMKKGFLYVRNPMNFHQVSRIDLTPNLVDAIVFWTKNPEPMLSRLRELDAFPSYIQMTLTGYGRDIEPETWEKKPLISAFQRTAEQVGPERMVWRYDPIIFTDSCTLEYHKRAFTAIAQALCGCTNRVVISYIDMYGKTKRNMKGLTIQLPDDSKMLTMASEIGKIAASCGMTVQSCAENVDLSRAGVSHGSCIDPVLIERICGYPIDAGKDKNQRSSCGCAASVEVGTYDTCLCGCRYCYANDNKGAVTARSSLYDPESPLLCGKPEEGDKVTVRAVRSLRARASAL